ncbi:DUF2182 domain-containing protein [Labrys sp. KNU-23]|uniref:copper chaperone n=1 Tax=Labrys sp. KNU-23 TaxID=2789216 RepID=UPI001FF0173D|nr:DUF2182 domain-containing protein [Labrys sp. KNU-23]
MRSRCPATGCCRRCGWSSPSPLACSFCWRGTPENGTGRLAPTPAALPGGLRLGTHCSLNSAGLTTILLATGLMDLRIMAAVTMAMTFERLAPNGTLAARLIGGATSVSALILIAKALGD